MNNPKVRPYRIYWYADQLQNPEDVHMQERESEWFQYILKQYNYASAIYWYEDQLQNPEDVHAPERESERFQYILKQYNYERELYLHIINSHSV